MSIKYNYFYPEIIDGLMAQVKKSQYLQMYVFEKMSFNYIQKFLLEHLEAIFNLKKTELLERMSCFVLDNEEDFDTLELCTHKRQSDDVAHCIFIQQNNLGELRNLGCSLSQVETFIEEVLRLSFYGARYNMDAQVSDIGDKLTLVVKEGACCNSSYEIDRDKLLNDVQFAENKADIADFEARIGFQKAATDKAGAKTITIEVAEMNIEDAFKFKSLFDKAMTSSTIFDSEICEFLSKKVTIDGKSFDVFEQNFINFLQGRVVLLYHIMWQIVRFVFCYNKKKRQFLPTIL